MKTASEKLFLVSQKKYLSGHLGQTPRILLDFFALFCDFALFSFFNSFIISFLCLRSLGF